MWIYSHRYMFCFIGGFMEKTKLAICIEDEEYRQRFVKCMMNHYKELFEIHVVNQMQELKTKLNGEFGAVIIGDDRDMELDFSDKQILLVLQEDGGKKYLDTYENIYYTEKYQEVFKIIEKLQKAVSGNIYGTNKSVDKEVIQRIGIFSLAKEVMQMPFAALLAEILGENHHVLLVDLQPFSGMTMEIETEGVLGMEDLLSIASTENYTINRLTASIGHEQKWEYIYPAKNTSCLSEVGIETYEKMLQILEKEQSYTHVIINFGSMFSGTIELMESCKEVYILTEKEEAHNYREHHFCEELNRLGKQEILQRILWTEIPVGLVRTFSWRQLSKQWLWSSLGDGLRERYWVE